MSVRMSQIMTIDKVDEIVKVFVITFAKGFPAFIENFIAIAGNHAIPRISDKTKFEVAFIIFRIIGEFKLINSKYHLIISKDFIESGRADLRDAKPDETMGLARCKVVLSNQGSFSFDRLKKQKS